MSKRIPLPQEPIADMEAVTGYDRGAKQYMMPEYRYFVRKILRKGIRRGRVLDIGAGSGLLAIELAEAKGCNFEIVGIDISENMVKKAQENAGQAGVADRVSFAVATASALPFPDGSFDLVMSYASLHHWLDPVTAFNEMARVTKKRGHIIVRDNRRVYQNPLWRPVIWLASLFMDRPHRTRWNSSISASYTLPELKEILSRSRLKDYRVSSDFLLFDICIEATQPDGS